ncbi:hypothetical protein L0Y59_04415 [Candidatus Uhrbacteria bacterium]|nr:hypothetical protein [Candidatus Uhrbacteria bacterium]
MAVWGIRPNGLTKAKRRRMSRKSFVFHARRAWPLDSQKRAKAAISYMHMGRVGTKSDYLAIRNEIIRRYGMGFWRDAGGPSWEKIARAKGKRTRSRRRRTTRVAANRVGKRPRILRNGRPKSLGLGRRDDTGLVVYRDSSARPGRQWRLFWLVPGTTTGYHVATGAYRTMQQAVRDGRAIYGINAKRVSF